MSAALEFYHTAISHSSELFVMFIFCLGITYLNIKIGKAKKLRAQVVEEIEVLKVLYCVKEIRESAIEPLLNNSKDTEYVITLKSTNEFREKTTSSSYKNNKMSVLKDITILEKQILNEVSEALRPRIVQAVQK